MGSVMAGVNATLFAEFLCQCQFNAKLMQWLVDKKAWLWIGILMKIKVDETASWWIGILMRIQVDEMAFWWK